MTIRFAFCLVAFLVFIHPAAAQPPPPGTLAYKFVDPNTGDVVTCDTLQQIKDIASAPAPGDKYKEYRLLQDERGMPTCIASTFEADVIQVVDVGLIHFRSGRVGSAWAIEIQANFPTWVLYVEYPKGGLG